LLVYTLTVVTDYKMSNLHMTTPHLNGLALLYVHRDIPLNYDSVIDDFEKRYRRLEF